ncbi:hypothetical protein HYV12_04425 [Candidatus Dojkabacteria bacterium]|nr:hypothetical protein [Candidatus Dojkabacteria bacterium]
MKRKNKEEFKQLNLGLKSPLSNYLLKIGSKVSESFRIFDLMKYGKDSMVWFLNTVSTSLVALQVYLILTTIKDLPSSLPIINYYNIDSMRLLERDFTLAIPIISILILIISFLLSYRWYNREKELVKLLLYIQLLSILALTVHLLKIVAIY